MRNVQPRQALGSDLKVISLQVSHSLSQFSILLPSEEISVGVSHQLLYATLPSESVCTENLTPFIKLLPCKAKSGIAMLLNPHRIFDADWHGMGVHVRWLEHEGIELRLTVGAVLNPVRLSLNAMSRGTCYAGLRSLLPLIIYFRMVFSVYL